MAYLSHSPYRSGHATLNASLLARSAMVAFAAGAVILCLSGASTRHAEPAMAQAAKSDRLTIAVVPAAAVTLAGAPAQAHGVEVRRDPQGRVVFVNDPVAKVTTVAKGSTIPLTAASPLGAAAE